jgi:UDP-N-acetylglucosamine--N-acetylmuramyl-(pentapeptide) pyrophosphoryl-undecaprenol N-acetylglucosamine transferase
MNASGLQRVILTTGGTGGHIFPALAVAEYLAANHPGCRILFVGGEKGPEKKLVHDAEIPGLEFMALPAAGVMGRGLRSLQAMAWMGKSLTRSLGIMGRFKPQVVLGLGGYAGFVPVLAARLRRVPSAIHEQNSVLGLTNKTLARWVQKIFLSFPETTGMKNGSRIVITGNPVRESIRSLRTTQSPGPARKRRLLILGGSQGAHGINEAVIQSLPGFQASGLIIRHQTGEQDFQTVQKAYAQRSYQAQVEPFIRNMAEAYGECDLVLCRAGASTLAELTVAGKPSILIPFPYATGDHQTKNAKTMERLGASMILYQNQLAELSLAGIIDDLFNMPGKLEKMSSAAWKCGRPEAAAAIAAEMKKLAGLTV